MVKENDTSSQNIGISKGAVIFGSLAPIRE